MSKAKAKPTTKAYWDRVEKAWEGCKWLPTSQMTAPTKMQLAQHGYQRSYIQTMSDNGEVNMRRIWNAQDLRAVFNNDRYIAWSPIIALPAFKGAKITHQKPQRLRVAGREAAITRTGDLKIGCQTVKKDDVAALYKKTQSAQASYDLAKAKQDKAFAKLTSTFG